MTEPERALAQARASLAAMRAQGSYGDGLGAIDAPPPTVTTAKLLEWALIEPDVTVARSTRRAGAPITGLKRLLLRLLAQYHAELLAQQTRFNVNVIASLSRLEERVQELERNDRAERGERGEGVAPLESQARPDEQP